MAKWIMGKWLNDYIAQLQKIGEDTEELCGQVVYEMAAVVADEVKKNINALPAEPDTEALAAYQEKTDPPITYSQKKGLQEGFGISPMQEANGYLNVKLGFDGYNSTKTRKYPKGQPNAMIARAIESGSSIRKKRPFIRPAVNKEKKKAIEKGQAVIDERIEAIRK